ncbi:MAG: DNA-directed polymerase subunit beta [bacterium]|nr:DNA-directed polymerase subunit beta [bacterium]
MENFNKVGRERVFYGNSTEFLPLPDLIEVQKNSFRWFLESGLREVFNEIFPIESYKGDMVLEFVDYYLGEVKCSEYEAKEKDLSYQAPLFAKLRLINRLSGEVKEEDVYMGDLPLMTERGTFIVNGTERVIVNQLIRSPGVYFDKEIGTQGREIFTARLIPDRGAWLEFELTPGEVISVKVDRRKKVPVTLLLKVLGFKDNQEILEYFSEGVYDAEIIEELVKGKILAEPVLDPETGEVLMRKGDRLTKEDIEFLIERGISTVTLYKVDAAIANTLERDPTLTMEDALIDLFRRLRPSEPARLEGAKELAHALFGDPRRYNLGRVGRFKLNKKLGLEIPLEVVTLQKEDICGVVDYLLQLRDGKGEIDDIDHLGNRRVRGVGGLLQNQFRIGLLRVERMVRDRMTLYPNATPQVLMNVRPIVAIVREFFGSNQLSQFMDQTNPLAELTHRRRLSALGPGGLTRERAGFEVRDVHYTHYGRICPIETPEGPNIGLVTSLSTYARVNEFGFIETPYRKVINGKVTNEVVYLTADEEDRYYIAQANTPVDEDGNLIGDKVIARHRRDIVWVDPKMVNFMDISPKQVFSVSTSLIPFLEHDDANRALMGSNMQRQAVPLVKPEAPLVGTGIERKVALDSNAVVVAKRGGIVEKVWADEIVIRTPSGERDVYKLLKFKRSNQGTCINQRPIVRKGDKVEAGDVIADGMSTDNGELALGNNVLVAFMPWEGYNFEDAIVISERLVKEDVYTSIHIEEYEIEARETKLGPEEITRDIPNVGEDQLKNLDENGIVRVGAEVKAGDILVGKVTPKGETDLTPEERLLRAIFGEKAREVRDTSLRVPHGEGGKVVDVKIFSRENNDELPPGVNKLVRVYVAQIRKISVGDKMAGRHGNKGVISVILPVEDMPYLPDGTPVDIVLNPLGVPSRMNLGQVLETHLGLVAKEFGFKVATPAFEGAKEEDVLEGLKKVSEIKPWFKPTGKTILYDGRTGEPFDQEVTVGYMYMMKLIHMVDDKIHARSTGPYSLITQQPLGGKAQFGGQRFGEMEVWALEGYGAAYTLQEMLTIKSDDIPGRMKTYEAIVKGEDITEAGLPESFKVLVKELQGLCLDVEVELEGEEGEAEEEEKGGVTNDGD